MEDNEEVRSYRLAYRGDFDSIALVGDNDLVIKLSHLRYTQKDKLPDVWAKRREEMAKVLEPLGATLSNVRDDGALLISGIPPEQVLLGIEQGYTLQIYDIHEIFKKLRLDTNVRDELVRRVNAAYEDQAIVPSRMMSLETGPLQAISLIAEPNASYTPAGSVLMVRREGFNLPPASVPEPVEPDVVKRVLGRLDREEKEKGYMPLNIPSVQALPGVRIGSSWSMQLHPPSYYAHGVPFQDVLSALHSDGIMHIDEVTRAHDVFTRELGQDRSPPNVQPRLPSLER